MHWSKVAYFRAAAALNFGQVLKPIWTGPSPKSGRKIRPLNVPHHFIKSFRDSLRPVFGVCTLKKHNPQFNEKKIEFTIFNFFPKKLNLPDKNFLYSSKIHIFLQKNA